MFRSYNVAIRTIFNIDRTTHRYMIESLSNRVHLKTLLAARYTNFSRGLIESPKFPVKYLARIWEDDNRTALGRTLSLLKIVCDVSELSSLKPSLVKQKMVYWPVPDSEKWRVGLAKELLDLQKDGIQGFTKNEVKTLLDFACAS